MASRFGKRRALPAARHASTLVASGARIDISDRKQIASYSRRISRNYWQEAAWVYNKSIPILGFCHDYVRDSLARVRPLPAIMSDDPDAPPIPLTKDTAPDGLDPDLCDQILQRLAPFPEYMGQVAHKLDICGEAYVALLPDDDEPDGERCRVFSSRELITGSNGWSQRESPDDTAGTPLPADAPLFRIWTPDPEWYLEPYSHMVRLNLPAEQLLLLSRLIKAIALSRMATTGKIIGIAEEFSLESAAGDGRSSTEDAGDGEAMTDPFIEDLMTAAQAAILDPESAAGVLPLILRGPKDLIKDGIVVHDVSRAVEDVLIKLRQEAREEIANGVNLPREIPLGIGDTNHWNAEEIRTQAWQVHLEPRALAIVTATTTAFFRPQLIANKVDPDIARRCVVWYDPAWFLGAPDLSESADYGFDNHLIGAESWRRAKGFAEDDKQEPDEVEYWVGVRQRERITIRETGVAQGNDVLPLTAPGTTPTNAPPPEQQGDTVPVPDTPDKTAPKTPLAAAAPRNEPLDELGARLVGIERDLRTKLHAVTEATVTRALESAGLKARNAIKNKATNASRAAKDQHRQLLAQIDAVPADKIIVSLGQTTLASYGLDHETLLAGALGTLEPKYRKLVARAQQAAAQQAAAAAGRDVDDDDVDQATDDARAAGWLALAGGVLALARNLMFNPAPAAPAVGEFDADTVVPMGLVRTALDIAGGAQPAAGTDATGGLGATTGPTMLDLFKQQLGIVDDQYEWDYGDAVRRTFEPHLNLDGVTFTSFEDDVLANGADWPDVATFSPGDHDGCVPAGVVVEGARPSALTLRWYEGALVELSTASGQQLAITPNHPVLTDRGWVAADALVEGDHLIRCVDAHVTAALVPDDYEAPTTVEDLFAARWITSNMVAARVPVAAEDFDGDGLDSEVAVVLTDRDLVTNGHTALLQPEREESLAGRDETAFALSVARRPFEGLFGVRPSPLGVERERSESPSFLGSTRVSEQLLRLPLGAWSHTSTSQGSVDGRATHAETLGECLDGLAGAVELDKLVEVRRYPFAGHVFNLHNSREWYIANGILVHNCLCSVVVSFTQADADTGDDTLTASADRALFNPDQPRAPDGKWGDGSGGGSGKGEASKGAFDRASAAHDMAAAAKAAEPQVTADLKNAIAGTGAQLAGLDFRLKTESSLERKIRDDAIEKNVSEKQAASEIKDTLRYTVEASPDQYTQTAQQVAQALQDKGYTFDKVKNTWAEGNFYRGINTQMTSPSGHPVELQFHTPASFIMKNDQSPGGLHHLFEEARLSTTSDARRSELQTKMAAMSSQLSEPPGAQMLDKAGLTGKR